MSSKFSFIPYGRQKIEQQDIDRVVSVLQSDFLTQGPVVEQFEQAVCEAVDAPYAVAVNSATSALHIACLALGVGPGDWVWTSPVSFVASSNCALYCNASVDFVDIDPESFNMSVPALRQKLEKAKIAGRLPKVVIPVHLCGQPCRMDEIAILAQEYGFKVIEDASHAIGGRYQEQPIGHCQYSDICVFSFHPVKIVTTAEGGCATTQDEKLAKAMQRFRSHGITRDQDEMTSKSDGPWYYQQIDLGLNYRMTELQAGLGVSQMERLHSFVAQRHAIAERYDYLLKDLPVDTPKRDADSYSGFHLYVIRLPLDKISSSRRKVFEELREAGIGVNVHYIPIHLQPYYSAMGFKRGDFPNAEQYYDRCISIPLYHGMSEEQQDQVVSSLHKTLV